MTARKAVPLAIALLSALLLGQVSLRAAMLTTYSSKDAFLAALGSPHATEGFDEFDSGTAVNDQITGLYFTNAGEGYSSTTAQASSEATSPSNGLYGGDPFGEPAPTGVPQVIIVNFSPGVDAAGLYLLGLSPGAPAMSVKFEFADETSQTITVGDSDDNAATAEFIGGISDSPILSLTLTSALDPESNTYDEFGIDDLVRTVVVEDCCAPLCSGAPVTVSGVLGINGTGSDEGEDQSGIASVALAPGAVNVTLTVDPFTAGDGSVDFRAVPANTAIAGQGSVVVTDVSGKTCSLPVTFRAIAAGPTTGEPVCSGPGLLLSVSNATPSPGGQSACDMHIPDSGDPAYPPGYEPSPLTDPFLCQLMTIDAPIHGTTGMPTEMVLKKDGPFEPRLRLLFSEFNGTSFPPFTDITRSVEQISTITPDPTRVPGSGGWSPVKVTCAIQAELCNGLDDDGDGLIDEGLPVGQPPVDTDGDGYPICPAPGGVGDCNDQNPAIHPGAAELCNGLDDNCNGQIDEGHPAGGDACTIPGLLGVCNAGATSCADGPMVCKQTHFPSTEVCDGKDNDCDGLVDENYVFGGYRQPVNADGTSIFKTGRTVPFKFALTTCTGANVSNAVAHIHVFLYAHGIVGTEVEDVSSPGQANTDDLYRYDASGMQYIYNLDTSSLTRNNSYLVRTDLDDGSHDDVVISMR
jgi:hypothetical protein